MKTWSRVRNDTDKISAPSWISDTVSESCVFNRLPFPKRLREVLGAHKGMEKLWYYTLRLLTSEKTQQKHSKALMGWRWGGWEFLFLLPPKKWPPMEYEKGKWKSDKEVIVSPHIIRWPWEVTKAKNSSRLRRGSGHFYRQQVKPVTIANVKKTTMGKKTKSLALGATDLWSDC